MDIGEEQMKKVGIATMTGGANYGNALQNYAVQEILLQLGYEAYTLNNSTKNGFPGAAKKPISLAKKLYPAYIRAYRCGKLNARYGCKNQRDCTILGKHRAKALHREYQEAKCRRIKKFEDFRKTYLRFDEVVFDAKAFPREHLDGYYAFVCGSDQVWNPDVTGEDLSYFLNFCSPETRRISYAPSFGLTSLPEDFAQKVRRELEQFQFISVREEEGQNLVEQMLHQDAPVVVDPTLLLNRDDWAGLERKHPAAEGEYILYYTVRSSKTLERFCKELAEKKNMKIIRVGGNMLSGLKNRNPRLAYASDIGPREWLYLVHHADCVVTNSFHGTAFSLIFQKDFYVEFSSTANSRMENLVRMTGLPSRIVKDGKNCADADESIDYGDVNTRLQVAREQSWDYLRRAVGDK